MIKQNIITSQHRSGSRGTLKSYATGFILSILLTLGAYYLVNNQASNISYGLLISIIGVLAIAQLAVQLQFFIHLGNESKPRWNKIIFLFMLLIVLIVVVGSLWIMNNLHYNTTTPNETETYIFEEEGITR